MLNASFTTLLLMLPHLLLAFTAHEFAHGYAAYLLGDRTAFEDGRLTWNPLKHIDIMGFIMIMLVGFGWTKPVRFDPSNFKNPKRDAILVAMAGPAANLLLTLFFTVIIYVLFWSTDYLMNDSMEVLYQLLITGVLMNVGLAIFNMLPFPPLDGSHLYMHYLVEKAPHIAWNLRRYGFVMLFAIIMLERSTGVDLLPIGTWINQVVQFLFQFV